MKTPAYFVIASSGIWLICLQCADAVDRTKNSTTNAVDLTSSWVGSVVPGPEDVMVWSSSSTIPNTAGNLPPQTADLSVAGIRVSNVGGTANQNTMVGFRNADSANTLTLGASGIDMSAATQAFQVQSKILIAAPQTWSVAQANTASSPMGFANNEDLGFSSNVAAAPFDFGGHKVTTTGDGYITLTSGYTLSNGTFDNGNNLTVIQSGGSRVTTLEPSLNLIVSSGRLRLRANTGAGGAAVNSAAPVTVNGGSFQFRMSSTTSIIQSGAITLNGGGLETEFVSSGPVTVSGAVTVLADSLWRVYGSGTPLLGNEISGPLSGSGNISVENTAEGIGGYYRLTGDNGGFTGTFALTGISGNRSLVLGSATAGSAAAGWEIQAGNTLALDGVPAQLGTLTGFGTVTNLSTLAPASLTVGSGFFAGAITDGLVQPTSLNKIGTGTLALRGGSTYTGLTAVSGGLLQTTPEQLNAGTITVADGAAFSVAQQAPNTTFVATDLTIGASAGGILDLSLGELENPQSAPIAVTNLVFNGQSRLRLNGKNLIPGTFDAIQYTNVSGFGTLALDLPPRTTGSMSSTGFGIKITITSTEKIKWNGDVSSNWDIDPDGTGATGTPNWLTTAGNVSARYIQGSTATDVVIFDDSATGGTGTESVVNLTTALAPAGLDVNNSVRNYTFSGPGYLTGLTSLIKSGSGVLTLANTATNNHAGGTVINAGTLRLGDGSTAGAGTVSGGIKIGTDARLILNRPDDHVFAIPLTGDGTLEKAQANTVTLSLPGVTTLPLHLSGGKLRFATATTLNGPISGPGEIEANSGLILGGTAPNTHTGMTTITAGNLLLSKPADTAAVGGDITVRGTGTMSILADGQIPDTSSLTFLGSSTDAIAGAAPGLETIANLTLTGESAGSQVILRNNFTINGTATVNQGYLAIASGHTASANAISLTSSTAILRIGGSGAPSILNVGAGGISASAGSVQVKFNTSNADATLNLAGDVTTTGNFTFTNASYTGANLNVINLTGARTFTIGAGTTTTIAPDIAGDGSLIKAGDGLLTLNSTVNASHTGGTTVSAGNLRVTGTLGGTVQVSPGGTLSGSGTLTGATTIAGIVSPGTTGSGSLDSTGAVELAADATYAVSISSWTGTVAGTHWDLITAGTLSITATPANPLVITLTGSPATFAETAKTLRIATSTNPITGFDSTAIRINAEGFVGTGTWAIQQTGNDLEVVYSPATPYKIWALAKGLGESNNAPAFDADFDGDTNLTEFALDSNPLSGTASGKVVGKIATVAAEEVLTLTLPVRSGAVFSGDTEQSATVDGAVYRIQSGPDLANFNGVVSEVTGADATAIQAALPALSSGWTYRTFRSPSAVSTAAVEFIRVLIQPAP